MRVDHIYGGDVLVSEWDGNKWISTEPLGEAGFLCPYGKCRWYSVSIIFILACSALQSMIVFVGAIVALESVSWKRRDTWIVYSNTYNFILNVFRNVGIVWLTETYPNGL